MILQAPMRTAVKPCSQLDRSATCACVLPTQPAWLISCFTTQHCYLQVPCMCMGTTVLASVCAWYTLHARRAEPGVSLPPTVPRLAINEAFTCTYGATHRVREAMQPYRVVAVMQSHTGDNRGPDLKTQPGGVTAPGTTCQQTFHQASANHTRMSCCPC